MIRSPKTLIGRTKYYDNHTLYVTAGVAREDQLYESLKIAIQDGTCRLNNELLFNFIRPSADLKSPGGLSNFNNLLSNNNNEEVITKLRELGYEPPQVEIKCNIKVNLIVNKNGEYYGFGYVRVSDERVYWMLLGRNPDGSERVIEYPDPNWAPPSTTNTFEEDQEKFTEMSWYEIAQEEDKHIQPIIREDLGPLMVIPGYEYDAKQYQHLQEVALKTGKDPSKVPTMGYFEFSRAYSRDVEKGKEANVLCARQIPDWIPLVAFKNIFSIYTTSTSMNSEESYPIITMINSKKEAGRTVLVTFDPATKDAIFALLMTRKVRIVHPKYDKKSTGLVVLDGKSYKICDLKCTLIFDHAYEYDLRSVHSDSSNQNNHSRFSRPVNSDTRSESFDRRTKYKPADKSEYRPADKSGYKPANTTNKNTKRYDDTLVSRVSTNKTTINKPVNRTTKHDPREPVKNRDDVDISKYNYTKK